MLECLQNTEFSLDRAVVLARASELAYHGNATAIGEALETAPVTTFALGNTQGYWHIDGSVALLAFRGSVNAQHWRSNFQIGAPTADNHPWGMAHPGFLASLHDVREVLSQFHAASHGMPHIWITGHSLGGALGVLAGAWLHQQGHHVHLYTYGQPMAGFENFTQRFDAELSRRLLRFINRRDIVARVPGLGYRHCGTTKTITNAGQLELLNFSQNPSLTEMESPLVTPDELAQFHSDLHALTDADLSGSLPEGLIARRIPWLEDHRIGHYVRGLTQIRDVAR